MNSATTTSGIARVDPRTLPEYVPTPQADFTKPEVKAAFEQER